MRFNSATSLGDVSQPSAVRTYIKDQLSLGAGLVYAPKADVAFSASLDIFGSLFVNTASFGGAVNLHFDTAVRSAGQVCEPPGVERRGRGCGGLFARCSSAADARARTASARRWRA